MSRDTHCHCRLTARRGSLQLSQLKLFTIIFHKVQCFHKVTYLKTSTKQRNYILDHSNKSQIQFAESGKMYNVASRFVLRGKPVITPGVPVCDNAGYIVLDITYRGFLRCRREYESGMITVLHGNSLLRFLLEITLRMQYLFWKNRLLDASQNPSTLATIIYKEVSLWEDRKRILR